MRRRIVLCGLVLLLLAGCGGQQEQRKPGAWVEVALLADGDAQVDFYGARLSSSVEQVRALARDVALAVFPQAGALRVEEAGAGRRFFRVQVERAYRTGRLVRLRIGTAGVWRLLAAQGFSEGGFRLWVPSVPVEVQTSPRVHTLGEFAWRLRGGEPAPELRVVMRPQPLRWGAVALLPLVGVAGVGLAFFLRRRWVAMPAAVVGVVAGLVALSVGAGKQGDNLGVAGIVRGEALEIVTAVPLAAVPLVLPALMMLVVLGGLRRRPGAVVEERPRASGVFW